MRPIVLAIVAIQLGLALPAVADDADDGDRSISDVLPLFNENHCERIKDPADQLFCGDPQLNAAAVKLNGATQDRLNRIPDRHLAIEENVQWISDRNPSCGIFGRETVRFGDIEPVNACLLKETEERIATLRDPNFDCLAANTAAGALICSDPSLALAEMELNGHALALIARLHDDDAREAFAEYARWTRERDRKCNLAGKDNVPLNELPSSEDCLAEYLGQKTAQIVAAKGDPKLIFGRHLPSPTPNADAVDLCVTQIHAANTCDDFLSVCSKSC
jgi:uncharacterized protein YecT (DUF1311 family)